MAALKHTGAKRVGVAAWGVEPEAAHAEALVAAALDATYVYRHTKPSAPPAPVTTAVTLVVDKAQVKAVQLGLTRGRAIGSGVLLAREWANRPGNHCTPTLLAEQAKKLAKSHDLNVEVLDRKAIEKLRELAEIDDAEKVVFPILVDALLMVESYRGARHQISFLPELTESVDALLRELTIVEKSKEWAKAG